MADFAVVVLVLTSIPIGGALLMGLRTFVKAIVNGDEEATFLAFLLTASLVVGGFTWSLMEVLP